MTSPRIPPCLIAAVAAVGGSLPLLPNVSPSAPSVNPTLAAAAVVRPRYIFFLFFFSHFCFPASGQAVVTSVVPSFPRLLPSIFIAHRVQQSHCSSIFHRVLLTHALALSASQLVHIPPGPSLLLLLLLLLYPPPPPSLTPLVAVVPRLAAATAVVRSCHVADAVPDPCCC